MVVQRSPPPVRRSPRKETPVSEAPFASQTSQARKIGRLASSTPSRAEPATPVQHAAASDFPSLDQMAAASKEQRSASHPIANRAAFTASFPAATSNTVPSSLPRPTSHVHHIQLDSDSDEIQRTRTARSSLTNGAIQRVRQQAGDETPLGVSQARAARQAATASFVKKTNNSLLADDSGDSTAQLVPGPRDTLVNPMRAQIDVENPQMPSLSQPIASTSAHPSSLSDTANNATKGTEVPADASTASQASIFGIGKRRVGQDQPIGGVSAGTAYDFSKYLDSELDPFNRASRANPRRESRPLPVSQMPVEDDDQAEISGDTTARDDRAAPSHTAPASAPIESTPLISRVKATSAPRMSPHASPSVISHKLSHLSSFSNGHATPAASIPAHFVAGDTSLANRYDPSARTDRLQSLELSELRKKYSSLTRELAANQDALGSAKEESEGWASECAGLQEQLVALKSTHQAAIARELRARNELQERLSQYKIEADDRAWKLLTQKKQACLIEVALQHAKNEATYHEGKYHATESELEAQKDELRIRLMLERKRADVLAMHIKEALHDGARLKKKLSAKSAALADLQTENEKLAEQLEHSGSGDDGDVAGLKQQIQEAHAEIETLTQRDDMMAETRKAWKAERKQLLFQIEELSCKLVAPAPAPASKPVEALKSAKGLKPTMAQMLPPSSPVYAKKKKPMQGASELGPPSEDEVDRRIVGATISRKERMKPLVPFAQISTKAVPAPKAAKPLKATATSKSKCSKNWRDEVAITDSSEEDSDDGRRRRGRNRSDAAEGDSGSDTGRATKKSTKTKAATKKGASSSATHSTKSATKSRKQKPSMPIEYDDQTADPSATPIIRSNKRTVQENDSDDEAAVDSSVLGAKFGRDRTNLILAAQKVKLAAAASKATAPAGEVKKKKRKLLGGGVGAMQWGGAAGADGGNDVAGLAPNFDIPLELSPIKASSNGAKGGGAAGFLAGFGLPSRKPFS